VGTRKDLRKKLDAITLGGLTDEVRRKLRGLSRGPADGRAIREPVVSEAEPSPLQEAEAKRFAPIVIGRDVRRRGREAPVGARFPGRSGIAPDAVPVALHEVVAGVEVFSGDHGPALLIETPIAGLDVPVLSNALRLPDPEDVLFLDLETTGLGATPLFLIGTMACEGGELVVRQYFARDYSEEAAVIALFLTDAAAKRLLVSFNGKAYDVPYVQMRAAANRLPFALDMEHLDLLLECRRAFRGMVPDCKLRTLEAHILGRDREDDIPGEEIPDAYHAFVRTGNAARIADILWHNLRDLVTLGELVVKLGGTAG
jgi:hypothetical protein